jgi:hypothetical protein
MEAMPHQQNLHRGPCKEVPWHKHEMFTHRNKVEGGKLIFGAVQQVHAVLHAVEPPIAIRRLRSPRPVRPGSSRPICPANVLLDNIISSFHNQWLVAVLI